MYIGTYTETDSKGIYQMSFNETTGEISNISEVLYIPNPTYLHYEKDSSLFAISETDEKGGMIAVIDPTNKKIISTAVAEGTGFCHLCLDNNKHFAVASGYHGGYFSVFRLENNSGISHIKDYKHEGDKRSHCHFAAFSKDNKRLFIADLGLDTLFCYDFNQDTGEATLNEGLCFKTKKGMGPRHYIMHPKNDFFYLLNELGSTIDVLRYTDNKMELVSSISTLPDGTGLENSCAAIKISADGRFLYASNRGHDSIAIFKTNDDGTLTPISYTSTKGKHPRDFEIDPSGEFLIAANRDTNNIVVFKINKETGILDETEFSANIPLPVCVAF